MLIASVGVLLVGALLSLLGGQHPRLGGRLGSASAVAGSAAGLLAALSTLAGGRGEGFRASWDVPFASLSLDLDALSAFFLLPILTLGALTAAFGASYLPSHGGERRAALSWFHFNVLLASMVVLVSARNGVLFLVAWETMALSSFFLVMYNGQDGAVRLAGWKYLVATHLGAASVLAYFALMAAQTGSLEFDALEAAGASPSFATSLLFLLALLGFGTKAGFVPLHVWLPEAHPAAPSHVSALMSGAMIKTGIYGLLRALTFLGPPPLWWGWTLILVGVTSGLLGVLFALAQHDLKRLLAYHSVENIGIIAIGIGVGLVGTAAGSPTVAFLGYGGALLHVLNHAVFKGLLFLGAGSVQQASGTRDLDRLGGLGKRMPWTAGTFFLGAAAISGLPPLNGFVSEFLIFSGAIGGVSVLESPYSVPLAGAVAALALIGGLAAACFAKAYGSAFLGQPRSAAAAASKEPGPGMLGPMVALAGLLVALGVGGPLALATAAPAVGVASGMPVSGFEVARAAAQASLLALTQASLALLAVVGGLALLRRRLLRSAPVSCGPTWDCGFAAPSARMQYTASSFAAPLTSYFRRYLRTKVHAHPVQGYFPAAASFSTHTPDAFEEGLFVPLFGGARRALRAVLPLQSGRVQAYVFYIAATLFALLLLSQV